ncbi:MAG: hypothetical protein EPN30_01050 [Actinomycetota bacterium]|nr:MAG: hypothetical protein EPN30_01050 [Actinomycetota bacterium]
MNVMDLVLFISAVALLWSRSLRLGIALLALEGVLLSIMAWTSQPLTWDSALMALATLTIKAGLIPTVLARMMNSWPIEVRRDHPLPLWAYATALVVVLGTGHIMQLLGPVHLIQNRPAFFYSLSTIYLGMVMVVARRHLLSQITALVSIENGLVVLGISLSDSLPTFVELGILADLMIAVALLVWMGRRIHREFQTTDVVALQALKG